MWSPYSNQNFSSNHVNAGRDFTVNNLNSVTNHYAAQRDFMEILKDHSALGALYDSAERFDPPQCHPETRTAVLDLITQWAQDSQGSRPILWLNGAAGAGKSAIAQTLIEQWKDSNLPVFTFIFWRTGNKRNLKTHLIATIAFQIANFFPTARAEIETVVRTAGIFQRSLRAQMDELIVRPLDAITTTLQPITIVVDGLDECSQDLPGQDHESQQKDILEAIAFACQKSPSLRFLVASRPERQIRVSFASGYLEANTSRISLNNSPNAHEDIHLFLTCKFSEIRKNNGGLDSSWPSEEQLSLLVDKSSGQFIYPSTVTKFVGRPRQNPQLSLEAVLTLQAKPTGPRSDYPLEQIDALYGLVLASVVPDSWPVVKDVLGVLIYGIGGEIFKGHWEDTLGFFQQYLALSLGELHAHLADVHSILKIPGVKQEESQRIRFIHATLSEFLLDQARSQEFFIDKEQYFLRRQQLLHQHVQQSLREPDLYNHFRLADVVATCSGNCPPSKEVRIYLWNLVKDEVGTYPELYTLSSGEPNPFSRSLNVDDKWRMLSYLEVGTDNFPSLLALTESKKCNIPEIEPSWLRRFLVQIQLRIGDAKVVRQWEREEKEATLSDSGGS